MPPAAPPAAPPRESPNVSTTAVTAWLNKNDAGRFKDKFFEQGFYDVEDLTAEEIKTVVGAESPGLAARLIRLLAKRGTTPTPPAIPTLPEGTKVDPAKATVTLPDGSQFVIPQNVPSAVADTPIDDPRSLTPDQWMAIARHMNLLHGADVSGKAPRTARKPALQWVVPATDSFVQAKDFMADVSTSFVFDASSARYVSSGFNTETATASYLFASASFSREETYSNAHEQQQQSVWITGSWWFPRVTLMLDQCTEVHPQFVEDVQTALTQPDPLAAVQRVFDVYGHAVQRTVTLGGELFFQDKKNSSAIGDASTYSQTVKAAVAIKLADASGSAGGSTGSSSDSKTDAQHVAESIDWTVRGGDPMAYEDRAAWEASVKKWNLWAVIRDESINQKATPTFDLLPADLQAQIRALLRGQVGAPEPRSFDTVTHIPSDGFVLATLDATPAPADGATGFLTAYTDGDPGGNPRTVRGLACVHENGVTNKYGRHASLLLPVRRGEYANVSFNNVSGSKADAVRKASFFSLGPQSDSAYLGDWANPSPIQLGQAFTAPGDGFAVCTIRTPLASDVPPRLGHLRLLSGDDAQPLAGSTVHVSLGHGNDVWYSEGSFCVPLTAGVTVTALLDNNPENPVLGEIGTDFVVTTDWLPLQGGLAFDPQHQGTRTAGTTYTAETDGFLVASLGARRGGLARLTVDVTPAAFDGSTPSTETLGRTSVHRDWDYKPDGGNCLAYNTTTVPIRAGSTYTINVHQDFGDGSGNDVEHYLTWTPLIAH